MSRIFVTGATGYIGGHLVESLAAKGHSLRCLTRRGSRVVERPSGEVEYVMADLQDAEQLGRLIRGCDVVYHLAGQTSARRRAELYQTNARGSAAVALACARQATPPRLIVVSSLAAAGTSVAGRLRADTDPTYPVSEYGRSKRAGELAAMAWADRVPISVVRPGIVFGERNREMLPMFQSIARFRLHAVPGFWPRRVALIHHAELIEILLAVEKQGQLARPCDARSDRSRLAAPDDAAGIYFAADPEFPTYARLGRMIAAAVGASRALIMPIAEPIAILAAVGNQCVNYCRGRADSFNLDKMREAFAGDWIGSTAKIERELGFRPRVGLQQRLRETARWYREQAWL